jgi:hypothetical protein
VSDLQCPATLVFVFPAGGSDAGNEAGELVASLRRRRCAAVYVAESAAAGDAGEALADGLGLAVRSDVRLHERHDEEQDADVVARVCQVLGEVADEHRGETVVLVAPAALLQRALPTLAVNVAPLYGERHPLAAGEAAEMRVDGDGWVLDSWMGVPPRAP